MPFIDRQPVRDAWRGGFRRSRPRFKERIIVPVAFPAPYNGLNPYFNSLQAFDFEVSLELQEHDDRLDRLEATVDQLLLQD